MIISKNIIYSRKNKYFGISKEKYGYSAHLCKSLSPTGKKIRIGLYKSEIEAAKEYDKYAFANGVKNRLNFPKKFGLPEHLKSYIDYENNCGYILIVNSFAIVDIEDFEKCNSYEWLLHHTGCAKTKICSSEVMMQRMILNSNKNEIVFFKNENKLDCRKFNIYNEINTTAQSKINKKMMSKPKTLLKIKESRKKTWKNKEYRENFLKKRKERNLRPEVKEQQIKSGKEMHIKDPTIIARTHETKKKNGSYGKSKFEDKVYETLCEYFGKENIEKQKIINGWAVDFYIKSIDTWLQADGSYWHGLLKPLDELKNSNNPQFRNIYNNYIKDRLQDNYFEKENLQLIRLTDKDFYKMIKEDKFHDWVCKDLCCIAYG